MMSAFNAAIDVAPTGGMSDYARGLLNQVLAGVRRAASRRRAYGQAFRNLDGLNDRALADLGIHRAQIGALAESSAASGGAVRRFAYLD